jgi:predicted DNA-binding transcriptional regulator AlpA
MMTISSPLDTTKILRRKDLAERLGVSTVTVWRLRDELPPAIRISKAIRGWRSSDIEAWIAARAEARSQSESVSCRTGRSPSRQR